MGTIVSEQNETTGQQPDTTPAPNPQLAGELAALEAEAKTDSQGDNAPDLSTPAGQWEDLLREVLPPVFQFADPDDEFEMRDRDFKALAKGVAPALGKHFPDLANLLENVPVELSAAIAVGMVMVPKIRKVNAKRKAAEAAAPKEVKADASEST